MNETNGVSLGEFFLLFIIFNIKQIYLFIEAFLVIVAFKAVLLNWSLNTTI